MPKRKKQELTIPQNPHDAIFKAIFTRKGAVADYITAYLPKSLTQKLSLGKMKLDTATYIDTQLKEHFADVVWRIPYGEEEIDIVLLFEHKKKPYKYVLLQVLRYMLNMWEAQQAAKQPLRVIVPHIVYQGEKDWQIQPFFSLFKGADDVLKAYIPNFDFIFKSLHNLEDREIKMLKNQEAHLGILTMARAFKERLLEDIDNAYIFLKIDPNDPDTSNFIHQLIVYILSLKHGDYESVKKELIRIKSPIKSNIMSIAEQLINHGIEKGINQGIEKGIELERAKKDEEIARKNEEIARKIEATTIKLILTTDFDDLQIAQLLDVTEKYVSVIREKITTENTVKVL